MRKVVKIDDILKDVECLENWEVEDLLDKLYSKYPVEFSDTFGETDVDTFVDEHEEEVIERLAWNNSEIDILKQLDDNRILEYVADTFTLDSVIEEYSYRNDDKELMNEIFDYYNGVDGFIEKVSETDPEKFKLHFEDFERIIINLAKSDPERFGKFITEKIIKR